MTGELDLHPASGAERAEAFRNLHDVWSGGMDPETHLQYRLTYAKHQGAQWYVGCLDGRVVVGCGCYPMALSVEGQTAAACAFGEVHTLAQFRRSGFAPRLLAYAEQHQRSQGRAFSFLYSDIDPSYYARLGYLLCPSHHGWTDPGRHGEQLATRRDSLAPFRAADELDALRELYDAAHARLSLSIARSASYWIYLTARNPNDEFFWLVDDRGTRLGFVRISCDGGELKIRDWSLPERSGESIERLLVAVIGIAEERGMDRVGGWLPDRGVVSELFDVSPRSREITMIKPLRQGGALSEPQIAAVDEFHEMDHV